MNSGIYQIRNLINNKLYIGSSQVISKRWELHKCSLKTNKHHNIHLQRAYNKYGKDNFVFEILEHIDDINNLYPKEQYYIDLLKPEYNIGGVVGGGKLKDHPNWESIKIKFQINSSGEKNNKWKGGISHYICPGCNKKIRCNSIATPKKCRKCTNWKLIKKKKHSQESIEKMKIVKLGNTSSSKKIQIDGTIYQSIGEACEKLNIKRWTINKNIKNRLPGWELL
jgi:group I intron endonuclease